MGKNGEPSVVISAANRLIQVPWSKLKFGDAKQNGDNKVIMSGETRDALNKMPEFHYTASTARPVEVLRTNFGRTCAGHDAGQPAEKVGTQQRGGQRQTLNRNSSTSPSRTT